MLVSPTEPQPFHALGKLSMVTEAHGSDFLFYSQTHGPVGIQRKEISDLVSSVRDGRLGKQLTQMKQLGLGVLLLEGRPQWTNDGLLLGNTNWTQAQHHGTLWSVQSRGIWLATAATLAESIGWLSMFQKWCQKERHQSLSNRPKGKDEFGKGVKGGRDFAVYMLQSFPGIGADTAGRIYDHFGGLPLQWTVTEKELGNVKGVGKERVRQLLGALTTSQSGQSSSSSQTGTHKSSASATTGLETELDRALSDGSSLDLT